MMIALTVVTVVMGLLTALAGIPKVRGVQQMRDSAAHLGVPFNWTGYRGIGILEIAAVVGLLVGFWWSPIGIAAAVGILLLMIAAWIFHTRAHDKLQQKMPATLIGVLAIAYIVLSAVTR
jgi:uncharacterized membrane protein YphA (DoxX/SURF4 family)